MNFFSFTSFNFIKGHASVSKTWSIVVFHDRLGEQRRSRHSVVAIDGIGRRVCVRGGTEPVRRFCSGSREDSMCCRVGYFASFLPCIVVVVT